MIALCALSLAIGLAAPQPVESPEGRAAAQPLETGEAPIPLSADGATTAEGAPASAPGRWSMAAVPRLTFSSDDGVGVGVRGTAFWHRWNATPYKTALSFQAWATTNLVQHHFVRVDAVDAFNIPLRLEAEIGLFQTLSANFCGLGGRSVCDDKATNSRVRFIAPYGSFLARLRMADDPRVQLVGGQRLTAYIPGTWGDATPFPGSPYAQVHPEGERGVVSLSLLGVVLDTRDFEPAPSRGVLLSVLFRGADPLLGSTWRFGGMNAQGVVFSPLHSRVVLAQRFLIDLLVGDAPLLEQMKVVGLQEAFAWGGQDLGRGLRLARFVGAAKALAQQEVRVHLVDLDLWGNRLALGMAAFLDAGLVAASPDALFTHVPFPSWGAGLALRASWNRTFVTRIDVAMSPVEGTRVGSYTAPGHPF